MVETTMGAAMLGLAAWGPSAHAAGGTATVLAALALQAASSALLAPLLARVSMRLMPPGMRMPWRWLCGYLFVLGVFVPLGGMLVCVAGLGLARLSRGGTGSDATGTIGLSALVSSLTSPAIRAEARRPYVFDASVPDVQRLAAPGAMPARPANARDPLGELLAERADAARRLAYGMVDAAEKRLRQQIVAEQARLAAAGDAAPALQGALHQRLAQLHWELVYQKLVDGDVRAYTLEQAEHHVDEALQALLAGAAHARGDVPGGVDDGADGDGSSNVAAALWQLRGRLALARNQPAIARSALQCAAALGFPRQRVLPLLAEAAFQERDFAEVGRVLADFDHLSALPPLQPVLRYWNA